MEYAFEDIKPELGLDYELVENTDIESDELIGEGKYTIRFQACNRYGRGNYVVTWSSCYRKKLQLRISSTINYMLRKFAL